MKTSVHTVVLRSREHDGRKVPPGPLGEFLHELPAAVRLSIRMVLTGTSVSRGKRPAWLTSASDIRLVDYKGEEETILRFEAPLLGEAAAELYSQQELWPTRPDRDDTGFDVLADIIAEITSNNLDSDRFDPVLLRQLARFQKPINEAFQEIIVTGRRRTMENPCIINFSTIETVEKLRTVIPAPRQVYIVGKLDMIRASTQTFALKLNKGEEVKGILIKGNFDKLVDLFQKQVLVQGTAIFRPSGRLLRIDAYEVTAASAETGAFSAVPRPLRQKTDLRQIMHKQRGKRGVAAILGKWPSDETDLEIEQALREMS